MKFDDKGRALPYPGNTIICSVHADNPAHSALVAMQKGLEGGESADAFSFLPPDSFHMTLYRGVNDRRRLREEWPLDLPLDMGFTEITEELSRRLEHLDLPVGFRMRPTALLAVPSGESQLMLEAIDDAERTKLSRAREMIKNALNHERPGEQGYAFHITFSYRIRPLAVPEADRLTALHNRLFAKLVKTVEYIKVGAPNFCVYADMLAYRPLKRLSMG